MNDQPTNAAVYAEQAFYLIERRRIRRRTAGPRRRAWRNTRRIRTCCFTARRLNGSTTNAKRAEDAVRQVLVVAPEHAPARQLLATLLTERDECADAELLLIGLLREYPENADLYGRYARLMLRTLHLEKAEQLAQEGLRYDPENDECLLAIALCETARGGGGQNAGARQTTGRAPGIAEHRARAGRGAGEHRPHRRGAPRRAGRDARRPRQRKPRGRWCASCASRTTGA